MPDKIEIGWILRQKNETQRNVKLVFERVVWWTGTHDDGDFTWVAAGTPGAKWVVDRHMGKMFLIVTHEEAGRFTCGVQYKFSTNCQPLLQSEEEDS